MTDLEHISAMQADCFAMPDDIDSKNKDSGSMARNDGAYTYLKINRKRFYDK